MPIPLTTIPPGHLDRPVRADVGRRLMQAVAVLATMRYATYPDLREQLDEPQDSSSFRKLVNDYLPRYDLAATHPELEYLFRHQAQEKYLYSHAWAPGDLLMWDNIGTVHNATADYGPDEPRYILRVQVMATHDYAALAA